MSREDGVEDPFGDGGGNDSGGGNLTYGKLGGGNGKLGNTDGAGTGTGDQGGSHPGDDPFKGILQSKPHSKVLANGAQVSTGRERLTALPQPTWTTRTGSSYAMQRELPNAQFSYSRTAAHYLTSVLST